MRTNRDFAVVTDANSSLETPDVGPLGAGGDGAQDGAFFSQGLGSGRMRSGAQLAVDLVKIYMGQKLVQQSISRFEVANVLGGEQSWETLLPEVMAAFDLALGLGSGSVEEGNSVEVEGCAQLSENFRGVSEEKGMVINVECQR